MAGDYYSGQESLTVPANSGQTIIAFRASATFLSKSVQIQITAQGQSNNETPLEFNFYRSTVTGTSSVISQSKLNNNANPTPPIAIMGNYTSEPTTKIIIYRGFTNCQGIGRVKRLTSFPVGSNTVFGVFVNNPNSTPIQVCVSVSFEL